MLFLVRFAFEYAPTGIRTVNRARANGDSAVLIEISAVPPKSGLATFSTQNWGKRVFIPPDLIFR